MLDIQFTDSQLLLQALVHTSYLNEQSEELGPTFTDSNERLEFLGDAVIGLIVAEYLYTRHPQMTEGQLTVNRAMLVRRETLAAWAREFQLDSFLYIARGEAASSDRTLAGLFEAITGALYLDQGLPAAERFIHRLLDRDAEHLVNQHDLTNYKGLLQEMLQNRGEPPPTYQLIETSGPAHDRHFTVAAVHNQRTIGNGSGRSKRVAEQAAAKNALEHLAQDH